MGMDEDMAGRLAPQTNDSAVLVKAVTGSDNTFSLDEKTASIEVYVIAAAGVLVYYEWKVTGVATVATGIPIPSNSRQIYDVGRDGEGNLPRLSLIGSAAGPTSVRIIEIWG